MRRWRPSPVRKVSPGCWPRRLGGSRLDSGKAEHLPDSFEILTGSEAAVANPATGQRGCGASYRPELRLGYPDSPPHLRSLCQPKVSSGWANGPIDLARWI